MTESAHHDPNTSWAQVELYRWQHGNLPGEPGTVEKPLDEAAGLRAMADALERACSSHNGVDEMPSPSNVCIVMRYVASLLDTHESMVDRITGALKEQSDLSDQWVEHYKTDPEGKMDEAFWKGRARAFSACLEHILAEVVKA